MTTLLQIENLAVDYRVAGGTVRALDGADLEVAAGQTVGVVGESGSGKSTLGLAVGALLPGSAVVSSGAVRVAGTSVLDATAAEIRRVRREVLAFVPQDPVGALDPTMRIGRQLQRADGGRVNSDELVRRLDEVQISDPRRVLRLFPHEISGGMAQRIVIAMAMARSPKLLIADEPTASLDRQVGEQILRLLFGLAAERGTGIVWLSHDLPAVSRWCGSVAVMYGGRVVEHGVAADVLDDPRHPYAQALAACRPSSQPAGHRLAPIGGQPPVLTAAAAGCAFEPRCSRAAEVCRTQRPPLVSISDRVALCHRLAVDEPLAADEAPAVGETPASAPRTERVTT